jgi:3-deoxy-7-phosphoheptulonate synthase
VTSLTDDLRIREIKELATPADVMRDCLPSEQALATVATSRSALHRILHGQDDRLAVVIGPCSIHDTKALGRRARAPRGRVGNRDARVF